MLRREHFDNDIELADIYALPVVPGRLAAMVERYPDEAEALQAMARAILDGTLACYSTGPCGLEVWTHESGLRT